MLAQVVNSVYCRKPIPSPQAADTPAGRCTDEVFLRLPPTRWACWRARSRLRQLNLPKWRPAMAPPLSCNKTASSGDAARTCTGNWAPRIRKSVHRSWSPAKQQELSPVPVAIPFSSSATAPCGVRGKTPLANWATARRPGASTHKSKSWAAGGPMPPLEGIRHSKSSPMVACGLGVPIAMDNWAMEPTATIGSQRRSLLDHVRQSL